MVYRWVAVVSHACHRWRRCAHAVAVSGVLRATADVGNNWAPVAAAVIVT
jgi:hypothetical protein